MLHRVASYSFSANAIRFSQLHSLKLAKLQGQISSGVRLDRPSDDALSFRKLGLLKETSSSLGASRDVIAIAESNLQASSDQLTAYGNVVTRARVLTQQGISAIDNSEREILASEVDSLVGRLQEIANTAFNGSFLFGGSAIADPPFAFSDANIEGRSLGVEYLGANATNYVQVSRSLSLTTFYDGREVFQLNDRQPTTYLGKTGASAGAGTDTLRARAALRVTHNTTTYLGASGVQIGDDSANGDTVIGQAGTHTLTVIDTAGDGSAGTIQLNSGETVAFTNADTNLKVVGHDGEVVYVNTTAIAAGFNGTIDLEATGKLSVDGGATETDIDFSSNQVVSDSATSGRIFVDSTAIRFAGTEHLEFGGTSSAFQILHDLKNDLQNTRSLSQNEQIDALERRLGELEQIADVAYFALGQQSASLATLDYFSESNQTLDTQNEIQITELSGTDIPNAVLQLQNTQNLLEYTYAVSSRLTSIGLLEFFR